MHSVPTNGFLFREQPFLRKIKKQFTNRHPEIEHFWYDAIKRGKDYKDDEGNIFLNKDITHPPKKQRSYAYCSDTAFSEAIVPHIRNADLLYHEATFMDDFQKIAHKKLHATAKEAAEIARRAEVGRLIIGHFSARYPEADPFVSEAREVFPETIAVEDGMKIEVPMVYAE